MKTKLESSEVRFDKLYDCKHSIRYKPHDETASSVSGAFYLMKETYESLDCPEVITITVQSAENLR